VALITADCRNTEEETRLTLVGTAQIFATTNAVAAFNVIQIELAEAIITGSERAGTSVILQISENAARYHGSLAPIVLAAKRIAEDASIDIGLHLDHAEDEDLVDEAIRLGMTSVMFDGAKLDDAENVRRTAAVVERAHGKGVWVEAELGVIGGKNGAHAPGVRTKPDEAAAFVAATGVDALAVAVGSSHAMTTMTASLDFALIEQLAAAVRVPLVLHGSSGVPDEDIRRAIEHGMRKINVSTQLNAAMTRAVRRALAEQPALVDPRKYLGPGREAVAIEVERLALLIAGCR
jgi:fructose-bisphosphate aldolase class II